MKSLQVIGLGWKKWLVGVALLAGLGGACVHAEDLTDNAISIYHAFAGISDLDIMVFDAGTGADLDWAVTARNTSYVTIEIYTALTEAGARFIIRPV